MNKIILSDENFEMKYSQNLQLNYSHYNYKLSFQP
jgi:hypothetical protein